MKKMYKIEKGLIVDIAVVAESYQGTSENFATSLGLSGKWVYIKNADPKKLPKIGYSFDEKNNSYIPPKPFQSWILDKNNNWVSPVPYPEDQESRHNWDEESLTWVEVKLETE